MTGLSIRALLESKYVLNSETDTVNDFLGIWWRFFNATHRYLRSCGVIALIDGYVHTLLRRSRSHFKQVDDLFIMSRYIQ